MGIIPERIMALYISVIINSTARVLDRTYLYKSGEYDVAPGDLVSLEFGNGSRKELGFVMETSEELPEDIPGNAKIRNILSVTEKSLFTPEDIPVMNFLRRKYLSSWLEAIRLFIPKGDLKNLKHKKKMVLTGIKEPENEKYLEIYRYIRETEEKGGIIKSEAVKEGYSLSSINTMIKKGYLTVTEEDDLRYDTFEYPPYHEFPLNEEQQAVFDAAEEKNEGVFLLHGVTGSGKTEVFLHIVSEALKRGEDSIILVPEIALTPQLIERVKGRFGKNIAVYHSRLSEGEKFDEWMRIKKGKVKIAIGARSALFLPFKNLKTVIVDEEHETSYKSEMNPKYVTREVAEFIMKEKKGKVILCSATPSIESYRKALKGEYTLLEMKKRAGEGKLPEVRIVDLRQELRNGNRTMISGELKSAMQKALENHEQTILFINRRGLSGSVTCRSCGYVYKCKNCDVSLTKHRGGKLICHHCGHMEYQKDRCPSCGSNLIKEFGSGTEKLEETVREMFPGARVMRMDRDTTSSKESYEKIYHDFKDGKADILIGTQMVAKGLDFDNVTLVGVAAADLTLNLPDFRAFERTFQLLTQVSGRAGRKKSGGLVIIQTYQPEAYPVTTSQNGDYGGFYRREITAREALSYPPEGELMSIVISSEDEKKAGEAASQSALGIRELTGNDRDISVLGPAPCLIGKLRNFYRFQILIKGKLTEETAMKIKEILTENLKKGSFRLSIDMNPYIIA